MEHGVSVLIVYIRVNSVYTALIMQSDKYNIFCRSVPVFELEYLVRGLAEVAGNLQGERRRRDVPARFYGVDSLPADSYGLCQFLLCDVHDRPLDPYAVLHLPHLLTLCIVRLNLTM